MIVQQIRRACRMHIDARRPGDRAMTEPQGRHLRGRGRCAGAERVAPSWDLGRELSPRGLRRTRLSRSICSCLRMIMCSIRCSRASQRAPPGRRDARLQCLGDLLIGLDDQIDQLGRCGGEGLSPPPCAQLTTSSPAPCAKRLSAYDFRRKASWTAAYGGCTINFRRDTGAVCPPAPTIGTYSRPRPLVRPSVMSRAQL